MGVPEPFIALVDYVSETPEMGERPGDIALAWLSRLHFGRWDSGWLKALWAAVGIAPVLMFVTGVLMWWNRVVRRRPLRDAADARVVA
jgi:uncharacterized iron-regulated membrane protein